MEQKKNQFDFKTFILIVAPVIMLLTVLLVYKYKNQNKEVEYTAGEHIPIPEAERDVLPESRRSIYEELRVRQQRELILGNSNDRVSESDFFAWALSDEDPVPASQFIPEEIIEQAPPQRQPDRPITGQNVPRVKESPATTTAVIETPREDPPPNRGGMAIVRSERPNQVSGDNFASTSDKRYFLAVLEENSTIRNNASVVFLLMEDLDLGDVIIRKNSYLFGQASNTGKTFDIRINEAKNTDGQLISLRNRNFFVYDEKYSKGLQHEGQLNESVKSSSGDAISDITSDYTSGLASSTARTIQRTVTSATKVRETTVNLLRGYKVYIKQEGT